jgi:hypothetical protein
MRAQEPARSPLDHFASAARAIAYACTSTRAREKDPATYLEIVAALVPKQLDIRRPRGDVSDDELVEAIEQLRGIIREQDKGRQLERARAPDSQLDASREFPRNTRVRARAPWGLTRKSQT